MNKELIKELLARKYGSITLFTSTGEEVISSGERIRVFEGYIAFLDTNIEKYIDIKDIRKIEVCLVKYEEEIEKFLSENKW